MAKGNEASYAKIGFAIILGVAAVAGTLVYIGGVGGAKHEFAMETYFKNAVSGLDVGSSVNFRGVKVGAVKSITFVGAEYPACALEDRETVLVKIALDTRLCRMRENEEESMAKLMRGMVAKGLHATVSASGVTGLSRIELDFPKAPPPPMALSWTPANPWIPPSPSILQSIGDSATRILNQIDRMDFAHTWSNAVDAVIAAKGLMTAAETLVDSQQGQVAEILSNVRSASEALNDFAGRIRENPSLILRDSSPEPLRETK